MYIINSLIGCSVCNLLSIFLFASLISCNTGKTEDKKREKPQKKKVSTLNFNNNWAGTWVAGDRLNDTVTVFHELTFESNRVIYNYYYNDKWFHQYIGKPVEINKTNSLVVCHITKALDQEGDYTHKKYESGSDHFIFYYKEEHNNMYFEVGSRVSMAKEETHYLNDYKRDFLEFVKMKAIN